MTKANSEFDGACKELDKHKDAAMTKKVRLAATVMESLETLNAKIKKMEEAKDMCIDTIISLPEDNLRKPKD